MADKEVIAQRIHGIIAEQLGVGIEEIKDESNIVLDLDADSLDVVELVIALEGEFDLEISDADAEKLVTVRDVVEYVAAHTVAG